ncbi:MAG: redoxin domain-containing protein [Thermomicrobiales bacterium]
MQLSDPLDNSTSDEEPELSRLKSQSRRFSLVMGLIVALAIVGIAWYVGGREGFGQLGRGGINLNLLPKVGEPAPDITTTLVDEQGNAIKRVRLSDFRGQAVWLNFWGSWCPPCRAEMPEIQAAYEEELEPRGLVWLAISLNEPAQDAAEFAARNHATFTIASDPDRSDTGAAYPIANFPTHILIDENGIVRDIVMAAINREEIIERAEPILPDGEAGVGSARGGPNDIAPGHEEAS